MRYLISDLKITFDKLCNYFYWNSKGSRVSLNSYVSRKATLNCAKVFGYSTILDEAFMGKYSYCTDSIIQHAKIGDYCSIAPGCKIGLEEYDIKNYSTHPSTYNYKEFVQRKGIATIGDHVWLGANVVILQGVKIGNHSVIAAGAVVTKDVPENEVWGGIPAKMISKR